MKKLSYFLVKILSISVVVLLAYPISTDLSEINGYDITEILSFEKSFTKNIGTINEEKLVSLSLNTKPNKQILTYTPTTGSNKEDEQKILFLFAPLEDKENLSRFSNKSRKMIENEQQQHPDSNFVLCVLRQGKAPRGIQTFVAMDYFTLFFCVFFRQVPNNISVKIAPSSLLTLESSEHNSITIPVF
jgi:hypothetical protein